jgi:hypothetical protein
MAVVKSKGPDIWYSAFRPPALYNRFHVELWPDPTG